MYTHYSVLCTLDVVLVSDIVGGCQLFWYPWIKKLHLVRDLRFVRQPNQGIEDMLNELRDKFTDERSKLEKEEMTLHHAHQTLMQELLD